MDKPSDQAGRVKSNQTLFQIIDKLWELEEAGVTELAGHIGVTKGTVHKHLKSLEDENYVVNKDGKYRLCMKFLTIGGHIRDRNRLCRLMKPKVTSLGERTDAIGVGAIEQNGQGIFVFFTGDYFNKNPIGGHFDLHKTAVGKAMLAEMEDDKVERVLERNGFEKETKHTITDRETLFEHLSEIRERKFAIAQGERTEHLYAVGAAIYEPESDTLGGMSIALPKNRVTMDELENELASEVLGTIDELQMEIKYG